MHNLNLFQTTSQVTRRRVISLWCSAPPRRRNYFPDNHQNLISVLSLQETKSATETSRTFATLFADINFRKVPSSFRDSMEIF